MFDFKRLTPVFLGLAVFALMFATIPRASQNTAALGQSSYWKILNKTYDGYLKRHFDEERGEYTDGHAWLKANQALLLFHTMRHLTTYARPEDSVRAKKIIDTLIEEFNYSIELQDTYNGDGKERLFMLKQQYDPNIRVNVRLNGKKQAKKKDFKIRNELRYPGKKYIKFSIAPVLDSEIKISYKSRKTFWGDMGRPFSANHMAWNYQTAEALYYAYKHRKKLKLSEKQTREMLNILETLADYSFRYRVSYNQIGLAWNSGILRYAFGATGKKKYAEKWWADTNHTLNNIDVGGITGALPDLDEDFVFNYSTDSENNPLSWDTLEYSNIVLRVMDDINYFNNDVAVMRFLHKKLPLLKGLRQYDLGNFMLNGYPNWDSGYGRYRQFISQYWPYCLYSLKTMLATPDLNQQDNDDRYARYLLDQAVKTFSKMDTYNADPEDGAIGLSSMNINPGLHYKATDANKLIANADFLGQMSLLLGEYDLQNTSPLKPKNIWHWASKQQKLAVSTPYYSTTIVGSTGGTYNRGKGKEIGMPYGGLEMTTLIDLENRPYTMLRPGSAPASFNFSVINSQTKEPLLDTFNALAGKQAIYSKKKTSPFKLTQSPNGDLSDLEPYQLKKYDLEFDKLRLEGEIPFGNKRYIFKNEHIFENDAIILKESVQSKEAAKGVNVDVSKTFPAGNFVSDIVISTPASDVTIYKRDTNLAKDFAEVKKMRYLHYVREKSGLLIIPLQINWGQGGKIAVDKNQHVDDYNTAGVRPLTFVIQSNQELKKVNFSIGMMFTKGTKKNAEAKYRLFKRRHRKAFKSPYTNL